MSVERREEKIKDKRRKTKGECKGRVKRLRDVKPPKNIIVCDCNRKIL